MRASGSRFCLSATRREPPGAEAAARGEGWSLCWLHFLGPTAQVPSWALRCVPCGASADPAVRVYTGSPAGGKEREAMNTSIRARREARGFSMVELLGHHCAGRHHPSRHGAAVRQRPQEVGGRQQWRPRHQPRPGPPREGPLAQYREITTANLNSATIGTPWCATNPRRWAARRTPSRASGSRQRLAEAAYKRSP